MDKKTLDALNKSIKHWEDNVERAKKGMELDISVSSCALCNTFCTESPHYKACYGCPVKDETGRGNCKDTPYYQVADAVNNGYNPLDACIEELEFLKSLLPEEK